MWWEKLRTLHAAGADVVVVTVIGARGSVPADPGAKALVTAGGRVEGTVGGGKIEARALELALGMLADDSAERCRTRCWNLQRDIGMTCGGEMTLLFELCRATPPWRIFIFGAGHVVQALVPVLLPLECRVTVFDTRPEWLGKLPDAVNLEKTRVERIEEGVEEVTEDGFVLSITQGHASDVPVLREVFRKFGELPFVGVIGSAAKRAVVVRELREAGISGEALRPLVCPLGLPVGGNSPAEIAISIAAQLMQARDRVWKNR